MLWLLFAAAIPAYSQFSDLATNADGSVLYFSTAGRQAGTTQPLHSKIFRATQEGVELFMSVEEIPPRTARPCGVSNPYQLTNPTLSDDERVVGWTGDRSTSGASCFYSGYSTTSSTILRADASTLTLSGTVAVSRNGRFAISAGGSYQRNSTPMNALIDLESGKELRIGGQYVVIANFPTITEVHQFAVSDDGIAVVGNVLLTLERARVLPQRLSQTMISRDGRNIAGVNAFSWNNRICVMPLIDGEPQGCKFVHSRRGTLDLLAYVGDMILFRGYTGPLEDGTLGPRQLFLINSDGSGLRQLTDESAGVGSATMSTDGRVVFYAAGSARLMKLSLETGALSEFIAASPVLSPSWGCPGCAIRFAGAGISPEAEVRLAGNPLPRIYVSTTEIVAQLPWDAPTNVPLRFDWTLSDRPGAFEFASEFTVSIYDAASWQTLPGYSSPPHVWASHDRSGWVTPDSAAQPGEVVHLYAVGLGPVTPSVRTAEPAPESPPAKLNAAISCTVQVEAGIYPLPVLFAGLAPHTLGFYEVTVKLPSELESASGMAQVRCDPFFSPIAIALGDQPRQ